MSTMATRPDLVPRVLVVEDQVDLAENIFEFLGETSYELDFAADGLTALHLLAHHDYDVIVLDIMLPGVSGFELCERIREDLQRTTPIILTTARDTLADKERGFLQGADDYLVKPFALRELQLRVDALCRRRRSDSAVLQASGIHYDPGTLQVWLDPAHRLELGGLAADIFEQLMRQYPRFCTHQDLARQVWGEDHIDVHTVRTHVYSLRKRLQSGLGEPLIHTVHGRGYSLRPPQASFR